MSAPVAIRVCVVGAGAAGLATAKTLSSFRHNATRFVVEVVEQGHSVGGTWVQEPPPTTNSNQGLVDLRAHTPGDVFESSMYSSLHTNLPTCVMSFRDHAFPDPPGHASFPHHSHVRAYLEGYSDGFGLKEMVRFGTRVVACEVARGRASSACGGWGQAPLAAWRVTTEANSTRHDAVYDAVVVCTGHFSFPFVPELAGVRHFPGAVTHSHYYRDPAPFAGKAVLVIGSGASAVDISRELAQHCPAVYRCHASHTGKHNNDRSAQHHARGVPIHLVGLPKSVEADGSVVLSDGSRVHADVVMFATGYLYKYPFLSDAQVESGHHVGPLYEDLFHAHHPNLAFVGLQFRVAPFRLFEFQAQWIAHVLSSQCSLPSTPAMLREVERKWARLRASGTPPRHFHLLGAGQWEYCNRLAKRTNEPPVPRWLQEVFEHSQQSRDAHRATYRQQRYVVDEEAGKWQVQWIRDPVHPRAVSSL